MINNKNLNKLISEALAIESRDAKEAGALGFMARVLIQATMPHSDPGDVPAWGRENGTFSMVMQPGIIKKENDFIRVGLPYGSYPRLLLAWLTTEAVKTKSPTLVLGKTLSNFMEQLGLTPAGGRWGTITRLKEQMRRLFSAFITCTYDEKVNKDTHRNRGLNLNVATSYDLWWNPQRPEQAALWQSTVTLGTEFFKEIIDRPVPIDMEALKALKGSSMRLDIYSWLTYRMSYLKKTTPIPWDVLQLQFGANFDRTIDFKRKFIEHLKAVQLIYPEAKLDVNTQSLILSPSKPHVPLIPL
jgi:hypothetical protein